jgi:mono/diheme cytochrome c family protein
MKKLMVTVAAVAGMAVIGSGLAAAQGAKEMKKVPITSTRADSGVEMFKAYCATCHGVNGKGGGPAAAALKVPPSDLTLLKQKDGGKFPSGKVAQILEGSNDISAHGSTEMPLWGPIFHSLSPGNDSVVKLRIANLTKYIESIQQ